MPPKQKFNVRVEKIPVNRPLFRQKRFPVMKRMYLEYIENKDKIIPELIDKEYIPSNNVVSDEKKVIETEARPKTRTVSRDKTRSAKKSKDNKYEKFLDKLDNKPESIEGRSISSTVSSKSKSSRNTTRSSKSNRSRTRSSSSRRTRSRSRSRSSSSRRTRSSNRSRSRSRSNSRSMSKYRSDDLFSKKIKSLLRDSPSKQPNESRENESNYLPTINELKQKGIYNIPKPVRELVPPTHKQQEEEDLKREILFKFELLKKSYKNANIPDYTIHTDYNVLLKSYDECVKRVNIDSNVESYKQYLIGGFMVIEYVFGNYLKLDMSGFAQQQIISINSYERLLIELGEKSYVPEAKNWPVEVRLMFMVLANSAMFILTKMLMKKTGSMMDSFMQNINTPTNSQPSKRKMKGPDLEDIDKLP